MAPKNCIEVSFEVANKVGGIYQVLKSKSSTMQKFYGDNYWTIGIYNEENARDDFTPGKPPEEVKRIIEKFESNGIDVKYGSWRVPGNPNCLLLDISDVMDRADDLKSELWEEHGIDSMNVGNDFDEPLVWSNAVGKLVNELEDVLEGETVVQMHEWLSAPAMFEFDSPSVFTTHATVLGRALSNSDFHLQEAVKRGEVDDSLAEEYGVKAKHQIEKEAARGSDVFTTVSKVTAEEAQAVLNREPDVVLSNGFNVEEFPSLEELSFQHTNKKERMKEFLRAYFEPYYDVDLEKDPRVMYISGRYEFHNKGLDVFIDALAEMNEMDGDDVFAFIFVPSDVSGPKDEVLENIALYQELEDYIDSVMPEMRTQLLNSLTSYEDPGEKLNELIEETSRDVESLQHNFHARDTENAPLCAYDLNYFEDEIIDRLQSSGLTNSEDDRVKVVFYPTYLSRGDRLLSMDYQDAIKASSAGIFPSYYEPWGYTPVETAANGALSVTTDMAGFGQFLLENTDESERKGIRVLERKGVSDSEAASNLAEMLQDIVTYSKTEITERKHNARRMAQLTSWDKLGENYRKAHEKAIK
ncbi:glycogen/starch synthase [Candidatus Nanohalococcus occultus]|uniref:Glycogen synthase n=1 Tax=Candidatus Nanohalococcus occultus TaxID=2978047 RepID=A0ABY8CGV2_9ARCH|nr:Glycogen synthase [Candidatus Nanohaloarchaeota archaeon SVXNc]